MLKTLKSLFIQLCMKEFGFVYNYNHSILVMSFTVHQTFRGIYSCYSFERTFVTLAFLVDSCFCSRYFQNILFSTRMFLSFSLTCNFGRTSVNMTSSRTLTEANVGSSFKGTFTKMLFVSGSSSPENSKNFFSVLLTLKSHTTLKDA